jgi:hypothetical protein
MRNIWSARTALLGTYVLLIAAMAAVVPGLGGPSDEPVEAGAPPNYQLAGSIELDLPGSSGNLVTTGDGLSVAPQSIGLSGKCGLSTSGTILSFGPSGVGFVDGSIGIRSKGNGQDCGQLDEVDETLVVSTGAAVPGSLAIYQAELDLEVQQNARVEAVAKAGDTVVGTFSLLTGDLAAPGAPTQVTQSFSDDPVASCNPASSSGPNAAARDNCRWIITPDIPFTSLELSVSNGKASLEGGGDGNLTGGAGEPSRFLLTQVLDCGDDTGTEELGALTGIIERLDDDPEDPGATCTPKSYSFRIESDIVKFEPNLATDARFMGIITKTADADDPVSGVPPTVAVEWIEYDKDGALTTFDYVPMEWCNDAPPEAGGSLDPLAGVTDSDGLDATWCVYDVSYGGATLGSGAAPATLSAVFYIYGQDDPHWR